MVSVSGRPLPLILTLTSQRWMCPCLEGQRVIQSEMVRDELHRG
jgi:hypothetical protein